MLAIVIAHLFNRFIKNTKEAALPQEIPEEYFADLISNVSHANGVFRVEFAQQHVNNEVRPVVRMLLPANQLQSMVRSIAGAANEIREKVQSQIDSRATSGQQGQPSTMGTPAKDAKPVSKTKAQAKPKGKGKAKK